MNAIDLLTQDHDSVKELLEQLESTDESSTSKREDLFKRIKSEMQTHEAIEEEIFYPALKEHSEAKQVVLEGFEEHDVVDRLMGELTELPYDHERWGAKAKVMKENIEHHIEEEEGEMFEKARDIFEDEGLEDLGARMESRKRELGSSSSS